MVQKFPPLARRLSKFMRRKNQIYRVEVDGIPIDVFPGVFPPVSPFSKSSSLSFSSSFDFSEKRGLDLGTGSGILAIKSALNGARSVDAIDINEEALKCAIHNVELNGFQNRINVFYSDLYSNIHKKYDFVLANLPILDLPMADGRSISLIDVNFELHNRFFSQSEYYLDVDGKIFMPHADLQQGAFEKLENLARLSGFSFDVLNSVRSFENEYRLYCFYIKDMRGGEE